MAGQKRAKIIEAIKTFEGDPFTWYDIKRVLEKKGTPLPDPIIYGNLAYIKHVRLIGRVDAIYGQKFVNLYEYGPQADGHVSHHKEGRY
jgi:Fe2+ or Zn2+ uptake regulation protein